jgi:C4-dicarboxylate transporter DctQ subunit
MLARIIDRLEEGLIALLLAVMTTVTFVQVVARYIFNWSFVWALELVTFLFAWLIFLGISYGVRVGSHIGMDAIVRTLPLRAQQLTGIVATLLCMAYSVLLFIGGWQYVDKMYTIGIYAQDLPIQQWIPRAVLPLGFALLFFRFAQVLFRLVTGRDTRLNLADEMAEAMRHKDDASGASDESPRR